MLSTAVYAAIPHSYKNHQGDKVVSDQFCTSCGYGAPAGSRFCENCGDDLDGFKRACGIASVEMSPEVVSGAVNKKVEVLKQARGVITSWVQPFNATLIFGTTLVAVFDFLSPRVALLPIAATIAVTGLIAATVLRRFVAPSLPDGSLLKRVLAPDARLHRSPVLVGAGVLSALMVTGAAWSSATSAGGGVIASKFDAARDAQIGLGVIQGSLSRLEQHAAATNQKLDAVQSTLSPFSNPDPFVSVLTMNIAAIKVITSHSSPPSIKGPEGVSPLFSPIANNAPTFSEGIALLASAKVNVDEPGRFWGFPSHAVSHRMASLTQRYERGQGKGSGITHLEATPLAVAVWVQNKAAIRALIEAGASLDAPISVYKDQFAPLEGKLILSTVRKEIVIAGYDEFLKK